MKVKGIVFYKNKNDQEKAEIYLCNKLKCFYPEGTYSAWMRKNYNESVVIINEDYWYCFQASENRRGLRANIIFYDDKIDKDIVKTIINPMCNGIMQEIYLD